MTNRDPSFMPPAPKKWFTGYNPHYEAVTEFALEAARNQVYPVNGGYNDGSGTIPQRHTQYPKRVQIVPNVDLPRYSLSTIYGTTVTPNTKTPKFAVDAPEFKFHVGALAYNPVLSPGSGTNGYYTWGYVVNEESAIANGDVGYGTLLQPGVPCVVQCDGTPITGEYVGNILAYKTLVVGATGANLRDLLCVSDSITVTIGGSSISLCGIMWDKGVIIEGMFGAIAKPTYNWTVPKTGVLTSYDIDSSSTAIPIAYQNSFNSQTFAVTNRDPSLSVPAATYGGIRFAHKSGEWRISWVAC